MRENQKRHYKNRKSTHTFKIGDLVLLRKHNKDKLELKWEPNYRIIKFPSQWSAVVENQSNGRTKRCNIADLKIKLPSEDWDLKPGSIGRAARFVNHPDNLPDVDFKPAQVNNAKQHDKPKDSHNKDDMINQNNTNRDKAQDSNKPSQAKYCLRKTIKPPNRLDL